MTKREMTAAALIELLDLLDGAGIATCLDGGWGVDALTGRQSRPHKDVDLIPLVSDVPRMIGLLAPRGFTIREGAPPDSFVLADGRGLEIDVHAVTIDAEGRAVYRMQNGEDWIFAAGSLDGRGVVAGRTCRCLTALAQVLGHAQGYAPTAKDRADMRLLAERFGVDLPAHLK